MDLFVTRYSDFPDIPTEGNLFDESNFYHDQRIEIPDEKWLQLV